jgi:PKD repeat protein
LPIDPINISDQPVSASATFSDPAGTADEPYSCTFDYGDGSGAVAGVVNGTTCAGPDHTYENPGVYSVLVTVTDKDDGTGSATATSYIVLYDPAAGFVTGGGWIDSPAGAFPADPDLVGRAHFGFVSRYQRGQTVPDGRTGFRFQAGDLRFQSTSYDWLVVAGPNAKYKGSGTINNEGDYGFMLTSTDADIPGGGESDLFRIKIWEKNPEETVVYDNQMGEDDGGYAGTVLGGGQIKIQTSGSAPEGAPRQAEDPGAEVTAVVTPTAYALQGSVPNPFNPSTEIRFDLPEEASVRLVVYDTQGRAVARLVDGTLPVGEHRVTFDGTELASGVYFYRLEAGSFTATRSMTLAK